MKPGNESRRLVDTDVHNPRGFVRHAPRSARRGRLQRRDGALTITAVDGGRRVTLAPAGIVEGSAATLRRLHHLDLTDALAGPLAQRRPATTARLLTALAAREVPLITGLLSAELRAHLHPDVVDVLQTATVDGLLDPLMREARAIRQRRAVLRRHTGTSPRSVSVLAATRRPNLVDRIAKTIGAQQHVDVELVLVTHGFSLRPADMRRVRRLAGRPVTVRQADEGAPLGHVLNIALHAAAGEIVSKLDDDDFYGPHHLEDLAQSLAWSRATLVGAVDEFTYLARRDLTLHQRRPPRHEVPRRRVPGPTMTIRRDDLLSLGGWARVLAHVDRELNDAVQRNGGTAHCIHGLGFVRCRHADRHTWPIPDEQLLRSAVETWPGFRPPPELYLTPGGQPLASLSSHVPITLDMNSGWVRKPIDA